MPPTHRLFTQTYQTYFSRECRSKALSDLPQQIRDEAEINFVSNIWQAIEIAFPNRSWNLAGPRYEDKPAGSAPLLSKL